ncbi:EamA domain-containing protein [Desulfonema limicola]|uniref:EamA domain-containing protein n=1 Tax=Desulfonema limicola TaxID=45656 RepID=A0A975BE86_9BACT|nr:DMT family transporter [Desulfonema limicola]QTA83777.1 EamA domain-containing protein [Desulfonema limicola]
MHWIIVSLLTALAVSSQDAWVKKHFSGLTSYEMSAYPILYSQPLFMISMFFVSIPELGPSFAWTFLANIPINALGFIMYMKAIQKSPLSLTIPYLAFTPVFMIITGYIFLDEMPGLWGIAGILIICAGGYILNIEPGKWHIFSPLAAVFKETGSWMMLIVAFIYSFGAVIGKKGILESSPLFFIVWFFGIFNPLLLLTLRFSGKIRMDTLFKSPFNGIIAGLFFFLHGMFHGWAISMTKAAYMISIKRLSVIFSIFYGKFVFKEKNISIRISGSLLMLAGTILISLQG